MDPSYNDSFGSFAQPTAVVSDGKGKKRWIIVAIIFVILALVAIIAVVFIGGDKNKTGFTPEEKYLNYIVNGDVDNNTNVGTEYSSARNYAFIDAVYLNEIDVSYFEKLSELLDAAAKDKESILYEEQKELINMFRSYKVIRSLGPDGIMDLYITSGDDGINSNIMDFIESLNGSMGKTIDEYKNDAISYIGGIKEIVNTARKSGCNLKGNDCGMNDEMRNISFNNNSLYENMTSDINESISLYLVLAYSLGGEENE